MTCPFCRLPLCPAGGHRPKCPSEEAQQARAWFAELDKPKERAVGEPKTLLQGLLRRAGR